jgi:hypothetical protein
MTLWINIGGDEDGTGWCGVRGVRDVEFLC